MSDDLKDVIDQTYPLGHFVAVEDESILADSSDFHELEAKLRSLGKAPKTVLIVEAGVVDPEFVTIFI